jgi:hypothetical protein
MQQAAAKTRKARHKAKAKIERFSLSETRGPAVVRKKSIPTELRLNWACDDPGRETARKHNLAIAISEGERLPQHPVAWLSPVLALMSARSCPSLATSCSGPVALGPEHSSESAKMASLQWQDDDGDVYLYKLR